MSVLLCCCFHSDLDTLLLPLLHMLYGAAGRAPSHLYMLLIILLILTQDASFAANVHKVCPHACHGLPATAASELCCMHAIGGPHGLHGSLVEKSPGTSLGGDQHATLHTGPAGWGSRYHLHAGRLMGGSCYGAQVQLASVPWYKERMLQKTSLGAFPPS
jgi:hypothetical protein